jgi:hypothetical protein
MWRGVVLVLPNVVRLTLMRGEGVVLELPMLFSYLARSCCVAEDV